MPNSPPFFLNSFQPLIIYQGETNVISLDPGTDSENTSNLTYTLVQAPANGTLSNCLNGTSDLTCDYTPDTNSTANVAFTYKVNDGSLDSPDVTTVFLYVKPPRSPVIDLSLGNNHSCALFQNGKIRCWGRNSSGQLGYGHTGTIGDNRSNVLLFQDQDIVDLGMDAVQISLGRENSCAVLENGHIKCWGYNRLGQLGYGHRNTIGDNENLSSVSSVFLGEKVKQVSMGDYHSCALTESGKVKCWGYNYYGQLGYGHTNTIGDDETLGTLGTLELGGRAVKVIVGGHSSCAVMEGGGLKCWGWNRYGQLGYGHTGTIGDNETLSNLGAINLPEPVIDVTIQFYNICAVFQSGNSKCWGWSGELGQAISGNIGDNETPFALANLNFGSLVNSLSSGANSNHTCALLRAGSVKCWGSNNYGQLGLGNSGTVSSIPYVTNTTAISLGQNAVGMTSGYNHTCVLLTDGNVKCWGYNRYGQLGLNHSQTIGDNETPDHITLVGGEGLSPIARIKTNFVLGVEDRAITFDGYSSYSSNPEMETYSWDFGDETTAVTTQNAQHTFTEAGTYTVSLTVTDENSNTDTATKEITILEDLTSNDEMMRGPANEDETEGEKENENQGGE